MPDTCPVCAAPVKVIGKGNRDPGATHAMIYAPPAIATQARIVLDAWHSYDQAHHPVFVNDAHRQAYAHLTFHLATLERILDQ